MHCFCRHYNSGKDTWQETTEWFFKLYIPQKYVHNLERNWKNFVCIVVKNFVNL